MKKITGGSGKPPHKQYINELYTPSTKITRILATLAHGISMNRFEAEGKYDHTLNSTISRIQSKYLIQVFRKWERVECHMGQTSVCRYWLTQEEQHKACELLRRIERHAKE